MYIMYRQKGSVQMTVLKKIWSECSLKKTRSTCINCIDLCLLCVDVIN